MQPPLSAPVCNTSPSDFPQEEKEIGKTPHCFAKLDLGGTSSSICHATGIPNKLKVTPINSQSNKGNKDKLLY